MAFPSDFLEQLRARIPVSEVVGKYVTLKKRGHEFVGLSPFKREKTPSFTVNDSKGFYHCFSSGEHGDIVSFLMAMEGLTFIEAVERLAHSIGLAMPEIKKEAPEVRQKKKTLYDVVSFAGRYFRHHLKSDQSDLAQNARRYLEARHLPSSLQDHFMIGLSDGVDEHMVTAAAKEGFTRQDLLDAGLCRRDDKGRYYSFFRERIIFPVQDVQGRIVAFGGRLFVEGAQGGKYINSPETSLFDKGRILYNFYHARSYYKSHQLLIVEGYMDVITLHQYGFPCVVAPLGTALTESQMALVWRSFDDPCLCFDGDEAGIKAAHRAAFRILPHVKPGKTLQFLFFPEGEDPDSFLKHRGQDVFKELLAKQKSLFDVVWEACVSQYVAKSGKIGQTPEMKAMLEKEINQHVTSIQDPLVQKYYQRMFRDKLWQEFSVKRRDKNHSYQKGLHNKIEEKPLITGDVVKYVNKQEHLKQKIMLATLLNHPLLVHDFFDDLARVRWDHSLEKIVFALQDYILSGEEQSLKEYIQSCTQDSLQDILCEEVYQFASQAREDALADDAKYFMTHMISFYRDK